MNWLHIRVEGLFNLMCSKVEKHRWEFDYDHVSRRCVMQAALTNFLRVPLLFLWRAPARGFKIKHNEIVKELVQIGFRPEQ